ncbi:MAG: hypothetical protein QG566_137 [Patescibacteria group bacterium]|nr:hypothetical protein [Patescibacteria group bacterium]
MPEVKKDSIKNNNEQLEIDKIVGELKVHIKENENLEKRIARLSLSPDQLSINEDLSQNLRDQYTDSQIRIEALKAKIKNSKAEIKKIKPIQVHKVGKAISYDADISKAEKNKIDEQKKQYIVAESLKEEALKKTAELEQELEDSRIEDYSLIDSLKNLNAEKELIADLEDQLKIDQVRGLIEFEKKWVPEIEQSNKRMLEMMQRMQASIDEQSLKDVEKSEFTTEDTTIPEDIKLEPKKKKAEKEQRVIKKKKVVEEKQEQKVHPIIEIKNEVKINPEVEGPKVVEEIVMKSLTPEDKKIIDENFVIEKDEVENNGENKFSWFKNKIADIAYGVKNIGNEYLNKVLDKTRKNLLRTGVVVALVASSFTSVTNVSAKEGMKEEKGIKEINIKEKVKEKNLSTIDYLAVKKRMEVMSGMSENAKKIFLYNDSVMSSENKTIEPYVIADKPTATVFIFDSQNNIIAKFPALFGQAKGEAPNSADANSDIAGSGATTPAGSYKMSLGKNMKAQDLNLYNGKIFRIEGTSNLAFHITYPGELAERTKALKTKTTEDNRMSWGCINISEENFDKYVTPYLSKDNQKLYITPDNQNETFNPKF